MDELLYGRVKQLKELDDRLDRMVRMTNGKPTADAADILLHAICDLRNDLAVMIQNAEQDHADF